MNELLWCLIAALIMIATIFIMLVGLLLMKIAGWPPELVLFCVLADFLLTVTAKSIWRDIIALDFQ